MSWWRHLFSIVWMCFLLFARSAEASSVAIAPQNWSLVGNAGVLLSRGKFLDVDDQCGESLQSRRAKVWILWLPKIDRRHYCLLRRKSCPSAPVYVAWRARRRFYLCGLFRTIPDSFVLAAETQLSFRWVMRDSGEGVGSAFMDGSEFFRIRPSMLKCNSGDALGCANVYNRVVQDSLWQLRLNCAFLEAMNPPRFCMEKGVHIIH